MAGGPWRVVRRPLRKTPGEIGRLRRENALLRAAILDEPPPALARRLLTLVDEMMPGVPAEVLFGDGSGDYVQVIGTRGFPRERGLGCRIPLGVGITGETARTSRTCWVPDVSADARYIPAVRGALWELSVPLVHHGAVVGVLDLEAGPPLPTPGQRVYLERLGLLLGPAFGRALRQSGVRLLPEAGSRPPLAALPPSGAWDELWGVLSGGGVGPSMLPIYELARRGVFGYEAEARGPVGTRWERPAAIRAAAAAAGPAARAALELAVIEAAVAAWGERIGRLLVAASPESLGRPGFASSLAATVRKYRFDPSALVIQVAAAGDGRALAPQLPRLRSALGGHLQMAIDHYGDGRTGGHALVELAPRFVKLDPALVAGIDQDFGRRTYVESLHYYTRRTGTQLIATEIGLSTELQTLRAIGVAYGQGPVFGS